MARVAQHDSSPRVRNHVAVFLTPSAHRLAGTRPRPESSFMSQSSAPPLGPEPGLRAAREASASPARGTAHAKAILVGEHSVVYGRPAIALPVAQLSVAAEIRQSPGPLRLRSDGVSLPVSQLPDRFASIGVAARDALAFFGLPGEGLEIEVVNDIPAGAGLGASAAVAHAVIEAVRARAGRELSDEDRFQLVQAAERTAHGNPSGLDAHATRTDGPLLFEAGRRRTLRLSAPLWFAIADTGVRSSTKLAVEGVASLVAAQPRRAQALLDELGELTCATVPAVEAGKAHDIGERMDLAQRVLDELGVGHAAIDGLSSAARRAGAHGAKLTGAGRGGCVIALAEDASHALTVLDAMRAAGAVSGELVGIGDDGEPRP